MTGTVLLAAGGTGGHVFPAQALARELAARGRDLALVTDARGADFGGAVETVHTVAAASVAGRGALGRVRALATLGVGVMQARRLLRRLAPAGVVGFGGYASAPAVYAATWLGMPTVIHEQNAVLGRANRLLAPRVAAIATGFAETAGLAPADRDKLVFTGNPVRPEVVAIRDAPYTPPEADGPLHILVTGGSQGAAVMARVVPAALAALPEATRRRLRVVQQCRADDLAPVRAAYAAANIAAELSPFLDDLPARLAAAHLVIARAGASTVAELTVAGRPALLVPYPHATDDHQTANARALSAAGGGWLMPEPRFTSADLARRIAALTPPALSDAAAKARALGMPDAAARLADVVERIMPVGGVRRTYFGGPDLRGIAA